MATSRSHQRWLRSWGIQTCYSKILKVQQHFEIVSEVTSHTARNLCFKAEMSFQTTGSVFVPHNFQTDLPVMGRQITRGSKVLRWAVQVLRLTGAGLPAGIIGFLTMKKAKLREYPKIAYNSCMLLGWWLIIGGHLSYLWGIVLKLELPMNINHFFGDFPFKRLFGCDA